ncbi:hypothetical protein [Geodermatophilus sp. URMC 63]
MTESTGSGGGDAQEGAAAVRSTPSGTAGSEADDLHGTAREVHRDNEEGGAEQAARTPGA